jgi:hypothetical protein
MTRIELERREREIEVKREIENFLAEKALRKEIVDVIGPVLIPYLRTVNQPQKLQQIVERIVQEVKNSA